MSIAEGEESLFGRIASRDAVGEYFSLVIEDEGKHLTFVAASDPTIPVVESPEHL